MAAKDEELMQALKNEAVDLVNNNTIILFINIFHLFLVFIIDNNNVAGVDDEFELINTYLFLKENIAMEEVFEKLRCTEEGLSSDDAGRRLEIFGYNKLEEKEVCIISSSLVFVCW